MIGHTWVSFTTASDSERSDDEPSFLQVTNDVEDDGLVVIVLECPDRRITIRREHLRMVYVIFGSGPGMTW